MIAFTNDCILEIVQKEISKQKLWKTYKLAVICFLVCSCTCRVSSNTTNNWWRLFCSNITLVVHILPMLGFVVHLCRKRPNEPQTLHCPNQMVISLKYSAMCISRTRLNTCFLLGLNHQLAFGLLGSYFSHFKRSGCSLDRLTHVGLALSVNLTRFRDILNKYSAGRRDSIPGLELHGLGWVQQHHCWHHFSPD